MRVFVIKNVRKILLGALLSGLIIGGGGNTAGAVGNVQATICGSDARAELTVAAPTGDSIVTTPSVTLRGAVAHATAIEIKIDDAYDSTLPLENASTHYTTTIMLQPGTHTISLQANDVCLVRNAVTSVVVTYHPAVHPSPGEATGTTAGGVVIGMGGGTIPARLVATSINPLNVIGRALDLDTVAQDGVAKTVTRLGLMMSGVVIATVGASLAGQISLPNKTHQYHKRRRTVRMCGLIPVFLALVV